MAVVIPDPRWENPAMLIPDRKPVGPVQIDWSNPLTNGLVALPMATGRGLLDPVGRANWVANRPQNIQAFKSDFIASPDTDHAYDTATPVVRDLPEQPEFTVVCIAYSQGPPGTPNPAVAGWSGSDDMIFYVNSSSNNTNTARIFWRNCPGGPQILDAGNGFVGLGVRVSFGVRFKTSSGTAYTDGFEQGIIENSQSATDSGRGTFSRFEFGRWLTQRADRGGLSIVSMWERALSDAEIQSVSADPYQFLIPA
jgi:hypothetical protein